MKKNILVTGASGGFGRLICETLAGKGHKVVGTMRTTSGRNAEAAEHLRSAGVVLIEMDVTDTRSVEAGMAQSIETLGTLDVLVNNAGVGVLGIQELFTAEDFLAVFDVNVVGVQRVMRAALPHMRKEGQGTVVFISSLLGRITMSFYGPYNATKWALEAMAENYRTELSAFGIESAIVEPGGYPTTFVDHLMKPSDLSRSESYGAMAEAPKGMLAGFEHAMETNPEQRPQKVADAIAHLVELPTGEKPFRTVVDYMGMGAHVEPYNDALHNLTFGIYSAFGNEGMLKVKKVE